MDNPRGPATYHSSVYQVRAIVRGGLGVGGACARRCRCSHACSKHSGTSAAPPPRSSLTAPLQGVDVIAFNEDRTKVRRGRGNGGSRVLPTPRSHARLHMSWKAMLAHRSSP